MIEVTAHYKQGISQGYMKATFENGDLKPSRRQLDKIYECLAELATEKAGIKIEPENVFILNVLQVLR